MSLFCYGICKFIDKKITTTPLLEFLANKKQERRDERRRKIEDKKKQRDDDKTRKKDKNSSTSTTFQEEVSLFNEILKKYSYEQLVCRFRCLEMLMIKREEIVIARRMFQRLFRQVFQRK